MLLASALIRAGLLVALRRSRPFPLLLVLAGLFTIAQTAHKPAQAALLPHLTAEPAAGRRTRSGPAIDNAAFVAGALAGGTIVAALGVPRRSPPRRSTFAASPRALHRSGSRATRLTPADGRPSDAWPALRVVARDPSLRVLVGVLSASTLIEGMVDVLVVVAALRVVDLGDAGVGWLNAAWGVGGVAGGAFALGVAAARGRSAAAADRRAADRARR